MIKKDAYAAVFDQGKGKLQSLCWADDTHNALSTCEGSHFGVPFVQGTQMDQTYLHLNTVACNENEALMHSDTKRTSLAYTFDATSITAELHIPTTCGPRSGVQIDFNMLDSENDTPWDKQWVVNTIYTDPKQAYAYFILRRSDGKVMVLTIDSPFAAWRLCYSYAGHRIQGMQILTQADDVVTVDRPLNRVDHVRYTLHYAKDVDDAYRVVCDHLGIGMVGFDVFGAGIGGTIAMHTFGRVETYTVTCGDESVIKSVKEDGLELVIDREGIYEISVKGSSGKVHTSRALCHLAWDSMYDKVSHFYRKHFQLDCGAFARIIWRDTLSPESGLNFEGGAFGDPKLVGSCRTGEFGGFAAWTMIKYMLLYGKNDELMESVDRYFHEWVLNEKTMENPYIGTICKHPHRHNGMEFGAYHLYKEMNYTQHEVFLLDEMVDYYLLNHDKGILHDLKQLAQHFVTEHIDDHGMVICQNAAGGIIEDYTTVYLPAVALIRVAKLFMKEGDREFGESILHHAEQVVNFLLKRGMNFDTEGESCTEDGSMACVAVSLLHGYMHIKPDEAYLDLATKVIDAHKMLEMKGHDCRMHDSSYRFWETQYETCDWGPSINAGHGWSIWIAEAKALLALINGDITRLTESYNGFITNMCKVEQNGAMTSCYTPDMIPGVPHLQYLNMGYDITDTTLNREDERHTTTEIGMRYIPKSYAVSGNYFLIKAAELWSHISGYDVSRGIAINGKMVDNCFVSDGVKLDTLLISQKPSAPVHVLTKGQDTITVICEDASALSIVGAKCEVKGNRVICSDIQGEALTIS